MPRVDEIATLAARSGLDGLAPAEAERLAVMADRVAAQVATIRRPLPKDLEPAHGFQVKPDAPT